MVNRQTIFDAREADNTHPLKAGPRPIKNLQATIEGAVRKSLLRNDCKGCRVKKKELNQIVMDQVARVHRELAFDTSFDFDASRSTEFFPNRVLDQGLMVTGATPRILVSKSLKSNKYLQFDLVVDQDGNCLTKPPPCYAEALKLENKKKAVMNRILIGERMEIENAKIEKQNSKYLKDELRSLGIPRFSTKSGSLGSQRNRTRKTANSFRFRSVRQRAAGGPGPSDTAAVIPKEKKEAVIQKTEAAIQKTKTAIQKKEVVVQKSEAVIQAKDAGELSTGKGRAIGEPCENDWECESGKCDIRNPKIRLCLPKEPEKKKVGEPCSNNTECITENCETINPKNRTCGPDELDNFMKNLPRLPVLSSEELTKSRIKHLNDINVHEHASSPQAQVEARNQELAEEKIEEKRDIKTMEKESWVRQSEKYIRKVEETRQTMERKHREEGKKDEMEQQIEKTSATSHLKTAMERKRNCVAVFQDKQEQRKRMLAERMSRPEKCLINGFSNVRTLQDFQYRVLGEGTYYLNKNSDFSIYAYFEAIDRSTVGISKIAMKVDERETIVLFDKGQKVTIVQDCQERVAEEGKTFSVNGITISQERTGTGGGKSWVFAHKHFSMLVTPSGTLPSIHRACNDCQKYFHIALALKLPYDQYRGISGLCGKLSKHGRESDNWYFGANSMLTKHSLDRFVVDGGGYSWCDDKAVTKSANDVAVAECYVVGDPHITTFSGFQYNLYSGTEPQEYQLFKHPHAQESFHIVTFPISKGSIVAGVSELSFETESGEKVTIEGGNNGRANVHLNCGPIWGPNGTTPGGTKMVGDESRLEIKTPGGTHIVVEMWDAPGPYMNVYVLSRIPHDGQANGLCGKFSQGGRDADKGAMSFMEGSWGFKGSQSYTEGASSKIVDRKGSVKSLSCPLSLGPKFSGSFAPLAKTATCEIVGPALVNTFSSYTYNARTIGNFLAVKHPNLKEEVFVSIDVLKREEKEREQDVSASNGKLSSEVLAVKSVAIKLSELDSVTISSIDSKFSVTTNCQENKDDDKILGDGDSVSFGGAMLSVLQDKLTVTTESGTMIFVYAGSGEVESVYISVKVPQDGQSSGMCGAYGARRTVDDLLLFGPLKSLTSPESDTLEYHSASQFVNNLPFCSNNDLVEKSTSFFEGSSLLMQNAKQSIAGNARFRAAPPPQKCEQLGAPKIVKFCRENVRGLSTNSKRYLELVRLFAMASNAELRQKQELSLEEEETNTTSAREVCQSFSTRVARHSCEADMFVADGNARLVHALLNIERQIEKTAVVVQTKAEEMRHPALEESSGTKVPLSVDIEDLCKDNSDVATLESICRQAGRLFSRHRFAPQRVTLYVQTERDHIESFEKNVFTSFSSQANALRKGSVEEAYRILVKYSIDDGKSFTELHAIPFEALTHTWTTFYVLLPEELRTVPFLRVQFEQEGSFCECCDKWSLRYAKTAPKRKHLNVCDSLVGPVGRHGKGCLPTAKLTLAVDEETQFVMYETDALPDSRTLRFEYSFANAADGGRRCGGENAIPSAKFSFEQRASVERAAIANHSAEVIDLTQRPKESDPSNLMSFMAWKIQIFASIDDGKSWIKIGTTPSASSRTSFFEMNVPEFEFNDKSEKADVKYRFLQETRVCSCCYDLFLRYVIPSG